MNSITLGNIFFLTSILLEGLLLFYIYKGYRSRRRQSENDSLVLKKFVLYAFSNVLWCLMMFLLFRYGGVTDNVSVNNIAAANIINKLAFACTFISIYLADSFMRSVFGKKPSRLFLGITIAVCLSVLPNQLIGEYTVSPSSNLAAYAYTPFFVLFAIYILVSIVSVCARAFIGGKDDRKNKVLATGLMLTYINGILFILVGPQLLSGNKAATELVVLVGCLSPLFIIVSSIYSLFRYKLFDIRSSALRAVGYSLSIVTLVIIYSIVIYGILLPIIYPGTKFTLTSFLLTAIGTATTVIFFDKIKVIFDAITDKLFFKNSYNLPKFLDEFNQALINSSDVGELASSIFKVMGETLKTEFFILIVKHDKFEITIDSRRQESNREADAKVPLSLMNYHFKLGERVVLRDYLDKSKFEGLFESLDRVDASAAIDLSESSKTTGSLKKALESGNFKAMLLGPKRSGESYNAQDLDALRIISKELVVGLQNAMRFEEIKLFNLELQHKVDLATGKLREQNKKLVVADELKDDFLSIASHQMRTPISAINGYASILNSGDAGKLNKNQQKFAKIIEDSTKRLSYLINDFLTVSRLKSGKFSIEKSETDLNKVLKSEVSNLTTQFKAKDVKLNVSVDDHLPIIKADESKIRQVMMNLIDNALYYTPANGEVNVTLKKTGEGIVFEVKDSGIGVPKDDQSKLFSKMFRAGNAQKMRPDGTGLGLYLAKKVVLGHHGHIIFNSVENEGSTFGFRIPLK